MTIDTTNLPPHLGADVQRVYPATGRPTKELLDQELIERDWIATNADDLQTQVTEVKATSDAGTASGNIRFEAVSAPGGVDARFALELQTSTPGVFAEAGFYIELTGSTSRITLLADQLLMADPGLSGGAPTPVFTYDGGVGAFVFYVPVEIRTADIGINNVSKTRFATAGGTSSVTISASDFVIGSELVVFAVASPTIGFQASSGVAIPSNPYIQVKQDGTLVLQEYVTVQLDTRPKLVGGSYGTVNLGTGAITALNQDTWWQSTTGIVLGKITATSNSHSIVAQWVSGGGMPNADWSLMITELKR